MENGYYSGYVVIPETVEYEGKTYSVTSIGFEAFSEESKVTGVIIPNSVTSIGDQAFRWCGSMDSVIIGNSVTSIGVEAFDYCSGLTSVKIPNSVTSIGNSAFSKCSGLKSVIIGNSVTSISDYAFAYCSGLTSIEIPNSVTSIGGHAFQECSGLTSIEIPNSVTSIGRYAFNDCIRLSSVTMGNGVSTIGALAFKGCSKLTSVHISDIAAWCNIKFNSPSLAYIDRGDANPLYKATHLYMDDKVITDLVIPNNTTTINEIAFINCSDLKSVTIPNSVTIIGEKAFADCKELLDVYCLAEKAPTTSAYAFDNSEIEYATLHVPETYIEMYKTVEPWKGFGSIVALKAEETPEEETPVEGTDVLIEGIRYKFEDNSTVKVIALDGEHYKGSITIPNTVVYKGKTYSITCIGDSAFSDCSRLTSVTIGNNVTNIGKKAFFNCSDLASIDIPNGVTSIGSYAFQKCTDLASIEIPNSVTSIGSSAFSGCSGLKSATIGNGIARISSYAFSNCSGLTSVTILNGITSIGSSAFKECSGLTSIEIPNSVTSIDYAAFKDCSSLSSIEIPNSVTSIGTYAFAGCSGLKSAIISNGVTSIKEQTFAGCSGLTSIDIPNSVTSIDKNAFTGCSGLTSIEIPNSVTSIGESTFKSCSELTSVTIGSSVTSIGEEAFWSCKLSDVYCLAEKAPTANSAFRYEDVITLHVPSASIEHYSSRSPWQYFGSIVALKDGDIPSTDGETPDTETPEVEKQNNRFIANDLDAYAGQSIVFPVGMINELEVAAFQCDVYLPEGITMQTKNGKYNITLDDNRKDDHTVTSALQEDGSVRIIVASLTNSTFSETSGTLFNLNLIAAEGISAAQPINIKNIHISDVNGKEITLDDVSANINIIANTPGDVNNDGQILVNDVVTAINYILNVTPENFVFAAADMDSNGQILVNDVVQIINTILGVSSAKAHGVRATETKNNVNKFYMDDFTIKAGESKQVAIKFDTENVNPANPSELNYVAFQFDLCLPQGLTVVKKKNKYDFKFNEDRMDDHTFTSSLQEDGSIRVVAASLSNASFWEKSGDFILFTVTASDNFTGSHPITLKNINFSDKAGEIYNLPDTTSNVTDGVVNEDEDKPSIDEETKNTDKFYMDNLTINAGESKQVAIMFETENVNLVDSSELNYVAFQFDLCLPQGLNVAMKKNKYDFKFNEDRMDDHTFTSSLQEDGSIRVVAASLSNASFWGKSGEFILFTVTASHNFAGNHTITLKNINFSDKAGEIYTLPDAISEVTDGVINGISGLDASNNKTMKIYTIDGKCVMKSAIKKGIYIVNGKKFYVK